MENKLNFWNIRYSEIKVGHYRILLMVMNQSDSWSLGKIKTEYASKY